MQLKEIIQKTTEFFKNKGIESARLDAELLIASVLNLDRVGLYLKFDYPLKNEELDSCRELVKRRAAGEPVAYILGKKDFFKSTFVVNKHVLIPRPETEEIVEDVLEFAKTSPVERVVDLGTGTGCIGLSIIHEQSASKLLALDVSLQALDVARINAEKLQVGGRTIFLNEDAGALSLGTVQELLSGAADVVVANPPYISTHDENVAKDVRAFEPGTALFADDDGLREISRWAKVACEITRPGGLVMFEIGATQGLKAREIFSSQQKFERIEIKRDLSGRERFVRAIKG